MPDFSTIKTLLKASLIAEFAALRVAVSFSAFAVEVKKQSRAKITSKITMQLV
jgi:hypothetical protein